jgi:hypothetical protein
MGRRPVVLTEICRTCGRAHEAEAGRTSAHALYEAADLEVADLRAEGGHPCEGCAAAVERLADRVTRWRNRRARRLLRGVARAAA